MIIKRFINQLLLAAVVIFSIPVGAQQTNIHFLSGTDKDNTVSWDFKVNGGRNSGEWKSIAVPSNWEMQGFGTYHYWSDWQKDKNIAPDSEGLYRTRFSIPKDWQQQDIRIVFGGVMTDAEVKINGQLVGPVHRGGFYQFSYPINNYINLEAENLLEVKVNRFSTDESINRAERTSDFWLFSGIYRPVWLEAKPKEHIERFAVDAKHTGAINIQVWLSEIITASQLQAQIKTLDGKAVGKSFSINAIAHGEPVSMSAQIKNIIPWNAENPQRYLLELQLKDGKKIIHQVEQIIGFRTVELRKGDGLYVNNVKVRLKGSNRHSIWPDSGRTTSKALSYGDARLMKDMNMNAVRMSHYPPDQHFLEVADELGLYVINELTGWQQAYSTAAGEPLVKELILRDHNHPSIIIWANGNEGGWNTELDDDFQLWDLQQRPVIHPWGLFGGINTAHYEPLNCCAGRFFNGNDVFMPTEFLHGLYDGGAGAGLNDWWNKMLANPLNAGGVIWAFADEGIVRADQGGKMDVAGNRAPDGIVGPYREKEGSFFAIKEIWSPVYLPLSEQEQLPTSFTGSMAVENRFDFTNLNQLQFSWRLVKFSDPGKNKNVQSIDSNKINSPSILPGERGAIDLKLPEQWQSADALYVTASRNGNEIYTWSWMITSASNIVQRTIQHSDLSAGLSNLTETTTSYVLTNGPLTIVLDKSTGRLQSVKRGDNEFNLANGPRLVTGDGKLKSIQARNEGQDVIVSAEYGGELRKVEWRLQINGWLKLTYAYQMKGGTKADYLGVTFDYPEDQVKSMRWLGKGPYRVWKNRTKGVEYGVWEKNYNDTVTGLSWNYPEFKGFHDKVYWAQVETGKSPFTILINDPNLNLRMLTPKQAAGENENPMFTKVEFPEGNISFLNGFTPIGTKFDEAAAHGPEGEKNTVPRLGQYYQTEVYFYFGTLPGALIK